MADTFVRSFNPIWNFRDLTGQAVDDTYYAFFLQNEIPYLPQAVYHTPSGTPWNNPIQLTAAGTLPVDVYFDQNLEYRIAIRQGDDESDPLIWLIENYKPNGGGGDTPITSGALTSDNQMTNPQFAQISFEPSIVITNQTNPDPIEVAPGWTLVLTGTGSATITREALVSTDAIPTNAPYALRLNLTGWVSSGGAAYLRQRFDESGNLWAEKHVSTSLTAKVDGSNAFISVTMVDSNGTALGTLLPSNTQIDADYTEFTNSVLFPAASNTDVPPAAWVEYRVNFLGTMDIFLTSLQVVSSSDDIPFTYEQETIQRQADHTFHFYQDELIIKPKDTILTAWNFALNPFQFVDRASAPTASAAQYIADQTIIWQETGAAVIQTGSTTVANRRVLELKANTAASSDNKFALIQYIDPTTIRPYWSYFVSSLVRARLVTENATTVRFKMRLIYRSDAPPTIGAAEPFTGFDATTGDPNLAADWFALAPKNDPIYTLPNANDPETASGNAFPSFSFDEFALPNADAAAMTLGIAIYTLDDMNNSSPEDSILVESISLVPNRFAVQVNPKTFDQVLQECQYYYQKSFPVGTVPAQNAGLEGASYGIQFETSNTANAGGPIINFPTVMRATPTITLYNPSAASAQIRDPNAGTNWTNSVSTRAGVHLVSERGFSTSGTSPLISGAGDFSAVHWTADAKLGK